MLRGRGPSVSPSISLGQMWRTAAVCCSLFGRSGTQFFFCSSLRAFVLSHVSVRTRFSVWPAAIFAVLMKVVQVRMVRNSNWHQWAHPYIHPSTYASIYHSSMISRFVFSLLVLTTLTFFFFKLQEKKKSLHARTQPGQSSHRCLVYRPVTGFVYTRFQ